MKNSNTKAFTLVELIVVITILAILGTIAFISLQGYSSTARDSRRISDVNNIKTSLELFNINTGVYPKPDNFISIVASGTYIGYQGFIGENVSRSINLNKIILDPLDSTQYIYSTSLNFKKYQLMSYFENGDIISLNNKFFINNIYANIDYTKRYIKVFGDNLGIILENDTLEPIKNDIDIVNTNNYYKAIIDNGDNGIISGTGKSLAQVNYNASCKRILEIGGNKGNGTYTINPTGGVGFQVYCDMITDGGGWTEVFGVDTGITLNFADIKTYFLNKENLTSTGIFIGNKITQNIQFNEFAFDYIINTQNQKINNDYYIIFKLGTENPLYSSSKYIFSLVLDEAGTTYSDLLSSDLKYYNIGTIKKWNRPSNIDLICNSNIGYVIQGNIGMRPLTSTIFGYVSCSTAGGVFSIRGNPVSFRAGDLDTTYPAQRIRGWIR